MTSAFSGMRLVVTGGGTGGHIYPALEVARAAADDGAILTYAGSLRGQEGGICERLKMPFVGYPTAPLYSLRSVRGWRSLISLLKARGAARADLIRLKPDCVFSTGGYSAGPVVSAAADLKIPFAIHECNSVPGRVNRMFASKAAVFTCTFNSTVKRFPKAVRTGQPIRRELRQAADQLPDLSLSDTIVLGLGGSQGSVFLNRILADTSEKLNSNASVLLAAGRGNYDDIVGRASSQFRPVPYLDTEELVDAYRSSSVAVARSGGTLAELALFGLPSVLIPLPTSADDHQLVNAREFAEMGAALLLEEKVAKPENLAEAIAKWEDSGRRSSARRSLQQWDCPNATRDVLAAVTRAASGNRPDA